MSDKGYCVKKNDDGKPCLNLMPCPEHTLVFDELLGEKKPESIMLPVTGSLAGDKAPYTKEEQAKIDTAIHDYVYQRSLLQPPEISTTKPEIPLTTSSTIINDLQCALASMTVSRDETKVLLDESEKIRAIKQAKIVGLENALTVAAGDKTRRMKIAMVDDKLETHIETIERRLHSVREASKIATGLIDPKKLGKPTSSQSESDVLAENQCLWRKLMEVTIEQAINLLNQALHADSDAITKLVASKVECNDVLGDHPTIQCGQKDSPDGPVTVGLLGILNGIFGIRSDGYGHISAIVDQVSGRIIRFEMTDR